MSDIKKVLIDFMENIRDYVRESGRNLAHDDRESEEFVDIFIKYNPELFKTKRQPLADGTLPLTSEELREFNKMVSDFIKRFFQITYQNKIKIYEDKVCLVFKHDYTRDEHLIFVSELKAILYLNTLFDLTGEK